MIEEFSRGYWLVEANVLPFSGDRVTTSHDMGREMLDYTRAPLVKVGGEHSQVVTERSIPADTIAVPRDLQSHRDDHVLMAKDETAKRVLNAGTI